MDALTFVVVAGVSHFYNTEDSEADRQKLFSAVHNKYLGFVCPSHDEVGGSNRVYWSEVEFVDVGQKVHR